MRYDHKKVRESNQLRAKVGLKNAIKEAFNSGLYYEDIMQIIAEGINEAAQPESKGEKSEGL